MFNYFNFTVCTKRLFCLCKTFIDGAVICKLRQNLFTLRYSGLLLYKQQQQQLDSVIQFALDRSELGRAFEEFDEVYRRSSDAIFLLYPSLIGTLPHDSMTGPIELMTDVMITH